MSDQIRTHYRACHLCEAICGLEIKTQGDTILSIKGDHDDPFSRGHICPKATALQDLHEDPERLRQPVKRTETGWEPIAWDQAFKEIAERVSDIQAQHGPDSVAVYAGNPNVHNYGNMTHRRVFSKALGSRSNYSATSLDQLPHHFIAYYFFGHQLLIPIPDVDHTDMMLIFGGNPIASNGSLMTIPDVKKRLIDIQKRGGEFIVFDPRRTETAEIASQHVAVKPGTDAYVLLAMVHILFEDQLIDLGHLSHVIDGLDAVQSLVAEITPELAERYSGVSSETIRDITHRFARAKTAVCYGRMGVSVQAHGGVCQWAVHLLNILTGNLDQPGGALFCSPAFGYVKPGSPAKGSHARFQTRVRGLPEFSGELPSSALAEEMMTEGEGQIRALFSMAGNPVISSSNGEQLDEALSQLDYMVSVDVYINETTRHAHIILPPTSPLEHDHYDISFLNLAVRDTARFNEPVFEAPKGALHDWEILNGLGQAIAEAKGSKAQLLPPPHMLIDMGLKMGPYGQAADPEMALDLEKLKSFPHGVDFGPLKTSLLERICTENGRIDLIIGAISEDIARLLSKTPSDELMIIGRRHVRSNNSWMHNYHRLVKGKPRWQLMMHPDDMAKREIVDGDRVRVSSRVGEIITQVQSTDSMMPGVVSLPHGWGHYQRDGVQQKLAIQQEGANLNALTDDQAIDHATGNAVLNGVPVEVELAS